MKKAATLILFCFLFNCGYGKETREKTFLLIFDKTELKENKSTAAFIELSLMDIFQTKSYSGNSDSAILIKIPNSSMDRCQLGEFTVRLNKNTTVSLNEIAFQIIDLNESKEIYQELLTSYEDKNQKTKRADRAIKSAPTP
jgi:hypothetical protein